MENLFDQGKINKAWDRMMLFKEESKNRIYDLFRHQWESRMNYLAAQILLKRKDLTGAEGIIINGLAAAQKNKNKKREGCFWRLLEEVQIKYNESEKAISSLREANHILKEVGNPRQLWQAKDSLASAFINLDRFGEARDQWEKAAEVIFSTAENLSDPELRENFIKAKSIRKALSNMEI